MQREIAVGTYLKNTNDIVGCVLPTVIQQNTGVLEYLSLNRKDDKIIMQMICYTTQTNGTSIMLFQNVDRKAIPFSLMLYYSDFPTFLYYPQFGWKMLQQ